MLVFVSMSDLVVGPPFTGEPVGSKQTEFSQVMSWNIYFHIKVSIRLKRSMWSPVGEFVSFTGMYPRARGIRVEPEPGREQGQVLGRSGGGLQCL